mgnify:CR=1 FL=1
MKELIEAIKRRPARAAALAVFVAAAAVIAVIAITNTESPDSNIVVPAPASAAVKPNAPTAAAKAKADVAKTANAARPANAPYTSVPTHLSKYEDFRILLDRNVFDRYRRPPVAVRPVQPQPTRPTTYVRPQAPRPIDNDQYFALLGIGLEGDQYTAYFEDGRAGKAILIQPGQAVGNGRVTAVNLDSVQYQRGTTKRIVKVGQLLTGDPAPTAGFAAAAPAPAPVAPVAPVAPRPAAPAPAAAGATPSTPAPAGGPTTAPAPATTQPTTPAAPQATPAPDPGELDIIERMKRKRQQELGI